MTCCTLALGLAVGCLASLSVTVLVTVYALGERDARRGRDQMRGGPER